MTVESQPALQTKPCPVCGEQIAAAARKCRFCGEYLDPSARPRRAPSALESLIIPVNVAPSAIAAGYLGLFAFVPFFGLLPGIAAIFLGWKALRVIKASPHALNGRGRAIFGIVMGVLTMLYSIPGLVFIWFTLISRS